MSFVATRTVRLSAHLEDDSGNPLANKTINFYYRESGATSWNSAGSATTDTNGNASVEIQLTAPATYDFRAEFPGDEQYDPSSAEIDNYAIRAKTILNLTVEVM